MKDTYSLLSLALAAMLVATSVSIIMQPDPDNPDHMLCSGASNNSYGHTEYEHEKVMSILGVDNLDRDAILSSALTKLMIMVIPSVCAKNVSLGDTSTMDIEVTLKDGTVASFHVNEYSTKTKMVVTIEYVKIGHLSYDVGVNIEILEANDGQYLVMKVYDGYNQLVSITFQLAIAPYDDDNMAFRVKITCIEFPDGNKYNTGKIVFLDYKNARSPHDISVIFTDNDSRTAVVIHCTSNINGNSVSVTYNSTEYQSNVIYVWAGKIIAEHVM